MASSWIVARPTKAGGRYRGRPRHRVVYRLGGAGSPHHYGGSFATKAEALERKKWIDGELAARRVPEITTTMTVTKLRHARGRGAVEGTAGTCHRLDPCPAPRRARPCAPHARREAGQLHHSRRRAEPRYDAG